ncbi:MAG: glycosyltransferase family 2 protein [Planctomycetaceae bacterium]
MPTVSVIIPTFNRAHFICETIESVYSQTFQDFEIIVVDDASTDNTEELLRANYGDRIKYIKQKNAGPGIARNCGILASQGEFIAFLDSDDLWYTDKLEMQVRIMTSQPDVGFVFTDCIRGPNKIEPKPQYGYYSDIEFEFCDFFSVMLRCNPVPTSSVLLRRGIIATAGLFDPTLRFSEDYDLWLRIAHVTKVYRFPEVFTLLREHEGRMTKNVNGMYDTCRSKALQVSRWDFKEQQIRSQLRHSAAISYTDLSYAERERANYREAYAALCKAMKYSDRPWKFWFHAALLRWCPVLFRLLYWIRGTNRDN